MQFNATERTMQGTGASRRLRKENLVPAIIYGGKGEPVSICVKTNELVKALEDEALVQRLITKVQAITDITIQMELQ